MLRISHPSGGPPVIAVLLQPAAPGWLVCSISNHPIPPTAAARAVPPRAHWSPVHGVLYCLCRNNAIEPATAYPAQQKVAYAPVARWRLLVAAMRTDTSANWRDRRLLSLPSCRCVRMRVSLHTTVAPQPPAIGLIFYGFDWPILTLFPTFPLICSVSSADLLQALVGFSSYLSHLSCLHTHR